MGRLFGVLLEEAGGKNVSATRENNSKDQASLLRDKIVSVLLLLEAAEGHFGAGDVLLGVLEIFKLVERLAPPCSRSTLKPRGCHKPECCHPT